ncbi:MAG: HAD-IIIA family hydrolase [Lentisphaeria bacterium]|nr:HAD-IIIA family hydrolase [Lentisphaeria bacterium]
MPKLAAFDLDGTLIDSHLDLAGAVNYMRSTMGLEPLEAERIVHFIGGGAVSIVRRAIADAEIDFNEAFRRMRSFYYDHITDTTTLYPGVTAGLKQLASAGTKVALVTNKPAGETEKILRQLNIAELFSDVIGGDSDFALKPEPDALLFLKNKYGFSNDDCWMIGDHYTDLEAGRRAGFRRIFVTYGFGETGSETPDYTADSFPDVNLILSGF